MTETTAAPKTRTPFWDNARFAAIVLVVAGHAIQRLTYDSDAAYAVYLAIYAFHMPAFAIMAGYFSKSGAPTSRQMARVLTDIVIPYVIFESLWSLLSWAIDGDPGIDLTQPSWTLWFLLALAIFRVALPYLALLRWPLLWTVAISVGAGYLTHVDATFSLSRALGLLPFFTLGWWLHEHDVVARRRLLRPRPWPVVVSAAAILAGAIAAAWFFSDTWRQVGLGTWMFYRDDYSSLGVAAWWAGGVRLLLIVVALVLSAAFFVLIPRGQKRWTTLGQYTMYVYLLHTFVLYPFRETDVLRDARPDWIWLPLVLLASVGIAVLLSSGPVRRIFRPLVEPRPAWLFADPTLAGREGRGVDPTGARRPGR